MDSTKAPTQTEAKLHFLDYWRIIRIRKTVILAVFLLVVITATVVTYILPETFAGKARMKVMNDSPDAGAFEQQGPRGYDPYFIQTEFEVLQSQLILGRVIENLGLNQEWGKKYAGGQPLKTAETLEILKKSIRLNAVRNASIIEVEVFSDKPEEAAKIANEIVKAYQKHRLDVSREQLANSIKALELQQVEYRKKTEAAQEEVDRLRTVLGISDPNPMDTVPTPPLSAKAEEQLQSNLILAKNESVMRETALRHLTSLERTKLREAIQIA